VTQRKAVIHKVCSVRSFDEISVKSDGSELIQWSVLKNQNFFKNVC
jgi:hypothetical protein